MDEIVLRAMAKWPDVPAVYGWLMLDRRGAWRLQGEPILNEAAIAFINRNYASNEAGQWFFQNGPQRVFVGLEYTPWVYFLEGDDRLRTHTGRAVSLLEGVWVDDDGNLLLLTEHGPGLVCDRDLGVAAESLYASDGSPCDEDQLDWFLHSPGGIRERLLFAWRGRRLPVEAIPGARVPAHFGFDPTPRFAD